MLLERKLSIPRQSLLLLPLSIKGVNTVPYRSVCTVPAGIYHTDKQISTVNPSVLYRKKYRPYRPCIDRTGQFRAILAGIERIGRYKKKFLFFIFIIIIF